MKKIGIIFLLIMATLVSCSDDDDESVVNTIIGTWELSIVEQGTTLNQVITFNENKTGSIFITITYSGGTETNSSLFTWSTNGNLITLIIDGETEVANYSIAGNKLTVTIDGETIVFTRK